MESDELLPSNTEGVGGSNDANGRRVVMQPGQGVFASPSMASPNPWISRGRKSLGKTKSSTIPLATYGASGMPRPKSAGGLFSRRTSSDDIIWSAEDVANADVATAISQDLVGKAERWKLLAGEPLPEGSAEVVGVKPLLGRNVDRHEVASVYVMDALAGRDCSAYVHSEASLRALKLYRNEIWVQVLNICTIVHLILPMIEISRCLPCLGLQKLPPSFDGNELFQGWRPTTLGSMWIESFMCILYAYHLLQQALSRLGDVPPGQEADRGGDGRRPQTEVYSLSALPPWQVARTFMVAFLIISLSANMFSHYFFGVTWYSWRQAILPFLFISRRTYLKHFVSATIRLLPKMIPVVFLISFVTFFYGFLGYIVYRNEPHPSSLLSELDLFDTPPSSALTFLRIFTARSFTLDVEEMYGGIDGVQIMALSYGVIMFIFLLALVPAVATHNFSAESKKSYYWAKGQRKLALTRAFLLLKQPDDTLAREDFVRLMACLRPDCDRDHTSALFSAAKKAEKQQADFPLSIEEDRNKLSKAGFFMVCALGTADFSRRQNQRLKAIRNRRQRLQWGKFRRRVDAALSWSRPGSTFPVSQQVLDVALLVQGYQIIRAGDDEEQRPGWVYPLGAALIAYFILQSCLRMIAGGVRPYFMESRNILETSLNAIGLMYYGGLWPRGDRWHSFYQILQASRLELLWNYLHLLGPTSSEVASRLELVGPAVVRASLVLFSLTYSYAVVAFALYCSTPLGLGSLEGLEEDNMIKRFEAVKDVASFETLPKSFASMMYVVMFSNWTMFMDAASSVGNSTVAMIFFYSFKIIGFYFIMPVLLGSTVTAYMNVKVQREDPVRPGSRGSPHPSTDSLSLARHKAFVGGGGDARRREDMEGTALRKRSSFGNDFPSRTKDGGNKGEYYAIGDGTDRDFSTVAGSGAAGGENDEIVRLEHEQEAGNNSEEDLAKELHESEIKYEDDEDDSEDEDYEDERTRGRRDESYPDGTSTEDDIDAPVVIASRTRSLSQTFWAQHQASDGGTHASTTMQGKLASLEVEIAQLRTENASLRFHLDNREESARRYVSDMRQEMHASTTEHDTSSSRLATSRSADVRVRATNASQDESQAQHASQERESASIRNGGGTPSQAHTIWGMRAIFESPNDVEASGDGLV